MAERHIKMNNIIKIFPPNNIAINDVSLTINCGKIHSVIGENGAGKSTLMKVLYGIERPNSGEIIIDDTKANITNPNDAVKYKIGMVHQEFMLIHEFTVLENILLGVEPTKNGLINMNTSRSQVKDILKQINLDIPLDVKVKDISIAAQQKVEIIKQLYRDVNVLILDEPTAVLTPQETIELFKLLKELTKSGKTIIFISHKLDEVLEISDEITIMRKGHLIWTRENVQLTKADLANAMVGRDILFDLKKDVVEKGRVILQISNLDWYKNKNTKILSDINLTIREGEILGIAGVEGNGQYELINVITKDLPFSGEIVVDGVSLKGMSIHNRRKCFSYVPQDRKYTGSSLKSSLSENILMTHHFINTKYKSKFGVIRSKKVKEFASEILEKYQVNTTNISLPIGNLSGGNQQKVILGREFELNHKLLIVDQPVRGLDVGSIEYVHNSILNKRSSANACLLVSADLDELFNLADRIAVMYKGRITVVKQTNETSKEEIGNYMLGVNEQ
jgi:simple sugar transport system ATP-binding protein